MNLLSHPDLLDQLAASYALGTLRGGARRRFEALARAHPRVRSAALLWAERLTSLTELQADQAPSANVWKRIENLLAAQTQPMATPATPAAPAPQAWAQALQRRFNLWRWSAIGGACAAAVLLGVSLQSQQQLSLELAQQTQRLGEVENTNASLQAQLQAAPRTDYTAVLLDERAQPALLLTFDARNQRLTAQRVSSYQEPSGKSLQLWAIATQGAPKSLGVLGEQVVLQLNAAGPLIQQAAVIAVSLEPQGGVAGESGPSGPVLFKGALVKAAL